MERCTVRPIKETVLKGFSFSELYVSPDLTFVSGITDYNNGIVDGEEVLVKSPYMMGDSMCKLNVTNVRRQGKVKVDVTIPVKTITSTLKYTIFYEPDNGEAYIWENNQKQIVEDNDAGVIFKESTQKYVEFNGDISYFFSGETATGYLIDHRFYSASFDDTEVKITTYINIEDGKLVVGEDTYEVDYSKEGEIPEIRLNKYLEPIEGGDLLGEIGDCSYSAATDDRGIDNPSNVYVKGYLPVDWKRVSKFVLVKNLDNAMSIEAVMYGGYRHYVIYDDKPYYTATIYGIKEDEEPTEQNSACDEKQPEELGYGVLIDGEFCVFTNGYGNDELFELHRDIPTANASVYKESTDEILEVHDSLIAQPNNGRFVILVDTNEDNDVQEGNLISAKSNGVITIVRGTYVDDDGKRYIEHYGKRYDVVEHIADTVIMSGEEYPLTYIDDEYVSATTTVDGVLLHFEIEDKKAKLQDKILYNSSTDEEKILVEYGKKPDGYDMKEISGITINGQIYPIRYASGKGTFSTFDELKEATSLNDLTEEDLGDEDFVVVFEESFDYTLEVSEVNGASTYLCYPVIDGDKFTEIDEDAIMREITANIVENWNNFEFKFKKTLFGVNELIPENGLMPSMSARTPYTISQMYELENSLQLFKIQEYISLKFPMVNNIANNIMMEDIIRHQFVDDVKKSSINTIVDMEKDVYYPVWISGTETNDCGDGIVYNPICQLRFNLHFRTRDMRNWKVINDDREFKGNVTPNSERCGWFITDYDYYKNDVKDENKIRLHNSSDLLGFLNFTTSEIKNRAQKIGKSFLRLSFYSTNNPNTQVLLSTSTVYLDENEALSKYMALKRNSDLTFIDLQTMEEAVYTSVTEYSADVESNTALYQVSSKTVSNTSEVLDDEYFSDVLRLSSRITVDDKYTALSSSEGFYFYMFKDYAKKMREATVYLRIDFNHAGVGATIPFMLPRKFKDEDDEVGTPLYYGVEEDMELLKDGFKMKDIYKQIYIPIRIKYSDRDNKYVYYLPNELRENDKLNVENEIMEFNLFEIKFANEAIVETSEKNQ